MPWVEVFAVLMVSHVVGDFIFQTEWQATMKRGGLCRGHSEHRSALLHHVVTYLMAFVPAFIWLAGDIGWDALLVALAVAIPHGIQDDGRLLARYAKRVKGMDPAEYPFVQVLLDQSLHVVVLFFIAVAAGY